MSVIDWSVMIGTISFIALYGWWTTRNIEDLQGYLRGNNELKWYTIGLSIMATQASAITFLSTPGQAYNDGMRFVQFYFGMPLAMIVICVFIVPIFYKLKVYTAYEYLETRFDLKVRLLGAFLFLLQRGLAAGITIYAPAIIVSSILGWSLYATNFVIGTVVILYTVSGGTNAVSKTQKQQMIVIFVGMLLAALIVIMKLPKGVSLDSASALAGALGRMNIIDFSFDLNSRYTFWSGMTGGFFLMLSYFGTDQSQVQRYLSGRSITESRLGLLFNGMVKIPMQFVILFIGLLVFVFYLFVQPPIFFNTPALEKAKANPKYTVQINQLEKRYSKAFAAQRKAADALVAARNANKEKQVLAAQKSFKAAFANVQKLRKEAKIVIKKAYPKAEMKDSDYVFITFIMNMLPVGLIGLLLAVILSAAMSSTASELNALGATTTVDFYRRIFKKEASDKHFLMASKFFTVFWGVVALTFATFASLLDNLIQAVNILGSIFYGTVLGIFLTAFFLKNVRSHAVFAGALIAQAAVIVIFFTSDLGYLWLNPIGCALVMVVALILNPTLGGRKGENPA